MTTHPSNRKEASAALRALTQQAKERVFSNEIEPREFAQGVLGKRREREYARLWAEHNLSPENRDLLFTLHALADDQPELEFKHKDLYRHLYKCSSQDFTEDGQLSDSSRQRLRRRLESLMESEKESGRKFIEYRAGYKNDDGYHDSWVRLYSAQYIEEIRAIAETDPHYMRGKKRAIDRAIVRFAKMTGNITTREKITINPYRKIQDGWKRVEGNLNATVEKMRQQGYEDWAIWQDASKHLPSDLVDFIRGGNDQIAVSRDMYPSETGEHGGGAVSMIPNKESIGIKSDTFDSGLNLANTTDDFAENLQICKNVQAEEVFLNDPASQAEATIEAFESVGATEIDSTITNEDGEKVEYESGLTFEYFKAILTSLLHSCIGNRLNLIIRPRVGADRELIQLDDLDSSAIDRIKDFAFLILETSPGNYQAWVCVCRAGPDVARRLKLGIGSDVSASGATRIAGSINFKRKYAPSYPRVRIERINKGRTVTEVQLHQVGLLAESTTLPPRHAPARAKTPFSFPNYDLCLHEVGKARNHDGPDRSKADFRFCLFSIGRGWSIEEAANELLRVSEKARGKGYPYALYTAQRAAEIGSEA